MAERPKHWIKLWVSWLTTPAHFELSEGAFGLGPLLLLLATWDGEYGSGGWLLAEDGSRMSHAALARATHRTVPRLRDQLAELVKCRTLSLGPGDVLGFANFGKWQETKEGMKRRALRNDDGKKSYVYFATDGRGRMKIGFSRNPWARVVDLSRDEKVPIALVAKIVGTFANEREHHERFAALCIKGEWFDYRSPLTDYVAGLVADSATTVVTTVVTTSETVDGRRQILATQEPPLTPPREGNSTRLPGISSESPEHAAGMDATNGFALTEQKPKAKPKATKRRALVPDWAPQHVLSTLIAACQELDGPKAGPRNAVDDPEYLDALSKIHAACDPTPEEWTAVIRQRLAMSMRSEGFGWLTWDSLCVAKNFRRWLADSKAKPTATPTRGPAPASSRPTETVLPTYDEDETP